MAASGAPSGSPGQVLEDRQRLFQCAAHARPDAMLIRIQDPLYNEIQKLKT